MQTAANVDTTASAIDSESDEESSPPRCWECDVNFTNRFYLYRHLLHHIKQPFIVLERTQLPPLKITLKSKSGSFEIVNSPHRSTSPQGSPPSAFNLAENGEDTETVDGGGEEGSTLADDLEDQTLVSFSPSFANVDLGSLGSPTFSETALSETAHSETAHSETAHSEGGRSESGYSETARSESSVDKGTDSILTTNSSSETSTSEYGSIPGAEPTPPPEPSPDYPKIRIKTTGLLKEPLTITEITDDNPDGDPGYNRNSNANNMWTTPSLEDPLKLPDTDDNNLLSLFNNNERAKDLGFCSSDNEFISLDRLEDRNRGTMQLYNPSTSQGQNPLDSLTGLPMQALAQQVSRLQPSSNGMHQQNVLINIQQFPSGPPPPQPTYQPPPMYPPHYPPHPGQPMHQPYQYQPPNPIYYPPAPPVYPPQHMPPPPQPQMGQMGQPPMNHQPQMGQQMQQQQQHQNQGQMQQQQSAQPQNANHPMNQQSAPYRQPLPPRQSAPRQQNPGARMPGSPRQPMGPRQPMIRQRVPMVRPRGGGMTAVRGMRPRMGNPQNGVRQQSPVKRPPDANNQQNQAKKKRFDMLTPDKDDDDCQVICMQPKNTDGGLPQIESVQGGTTEPAESSIMHLSDSITLSVRNPPPKPASPKKSDAKAVANILATRGITVTATAKPKDKPESPQKTPPALPTSLNLNGAVSILPAAKNNGNAKPASDALPTVDLTDDAGPQSAGSNSPSKQRAGLPYRCDLCPAQYPNAVGLNKHRQSYHKTSGGMCELGVPLINLKQPGILQKLSALGVSNYIPLPSAGPDGTFALPVISTRNPGNVSAIGATTMLSLGPVRSIPKTSQNNQGNNAGVVKQLNMSNQKS